jgi:GTP pyrophosphokinase
VSSSTTSTTHATAAVYQPGAEVRGVESILQTIRGYAPDADFGVVMTAYLLAARAHAGQTRKSGEPYIMHPIAVAQILADMKMDVDTIATALLHDALEDNPITKEEMTAQVGPVITELVDGVTKIGKLRYRSKEELQAENFRKMMLAMSKDLRVILVKLADRMHNMRTLDGHREEKRRTIATETLEIFVPIANRLGLTHLKSELEDLCVHHLDPEAHAAIVSYLDDTEGDRQAYIQETARALQAEIEAAGIPGRVSGRAKAVSSIYHKMRDKLVDVAEVPDILAFRIIVKDVGSCYLMLGNIHAKYAPVPDRIKDYIARPKPNGYQSLHTTVIGPSRKRVEIQIRTERMHEVAEQGVAAHWQYKEGHLARKPEEMAETVALRELLDVAREAESAVDFQAAAKRTFYAEEVFVFTPAGEVKRLPLGATPIDFAYAIHTDVGAHCSGAKADGRIVPLDYKLKTGQRVEILTRPDQRPRRDWLEIAVTSRALTKIRRAISLEEEAEAQTIGRNLLDAELRRFDWTLDKAKSQGRLDAYLKERGVRSVDALWVEVGQGHQTPGDVAKQILPEGTWYSVQEEARRSRLANLLSPFARKTSRSPVLITGEDGLLVGYARCCNPLPGEEVVGYITRGHGISVHRVDCKSLAALDEDRRVGVEWDLQQRTRHSVQVHVYCADRPGMLASISKVCDHAHVNIEKAEATSLDPRAGLGLVKLQVAVNDLADLTRVIRNLEKVAGVERVDRA